MATFVLVHGAWHGGWCWKKVTPLLRAAGHEVYTPTLTGLGERAHLATPAVDLDTHIQDVTAVLECEDLRDVVLVGHSYGGMVITGVADRAGDRLAHLVYLDAFVPENGQSVRPSRQPESGRPPASSQGSDEPPPYVPAPPPANFGVTDPEDVSWMTPRLAPHPPATFTQPLRLAGTAPLLPSTYILCTDPLFPNADNPILTRFAERARTDPAWQYHELATGHDAMVTAPREVAGILLAAVESRAMPA
jgi:pimeloyl-ACP methyl ester carboxylesterase